jgi:hypothetical protein
VKTGWKSWKKKWREKAFQKESAFKLGKALPTN